MPAIAYTPASLNRHWMSEFAALCGENIPSCLRGDCALFAVALARAVGGAVCYVEERGADGFICHAATDCRGRLYDGNGATSRDSMSVWCDSPCKAVFSVADPTDDFLHFATKATSTDLSYAEVEAGVQRLMAAMFDEH